MKGLSNVLKNLNRVIEKNHQNNIKGLTEAALVVKAESVKDTPIDLGNLRGSAYIVVTDKSSDNASPSFKGDDSGELSSSHNKAVSETTRIVQKNGKWSPSAVVGYGAYYSFYVHEMPMINAGEPRAEPRKGNYWDGGGNKFLEKALFKNRSRIKQILKKWNKV